MSDAPENFDLKFLPDWLKEAPVENRYANYEGESSDRPRRDRDDRRGPGGPGGDRRGPRPPQSDRSRGPRPGGPPGQRPGGTRPGDRPGGARPGDRRQDDRRGPDRPFRDGPRPAPTPAPAELRIDFLPEPNAAAGIARQIKSSGRSYAVFSTAKLFLERPERHRVRIASSLPEVLLFQVGDGPVSFERAAVERGAFPQRRAEYYAEETVQGEPIKGNFRNVARCRSTGTLLGPTNHHGYQPALHKLYEERFSRRMSFPEFQQHEIEISTSEQAVEQWKEEARTSVTFTTIKEAEPITFKSLAEVEQHFRQTYLPQLVQSGPTLECSGEASRANLDRHVTQAVRDAWERERAFPQGLVNQLRPFFQEAGLHFFKHRKRMLHVTATKPLWHATDQPLSDGLTAIFQTITAQPRIKRPTLADKILGPGHDAPEIAARKAQLASDLHYLLHMGHVIEFADGSLDLPISPRGEDPAPKKAAPVPVEASSPTDPPAASEPAAALGLESVADAPPIESTLAPETEAPPSADPEQVNEDQLASSKPVDPLEIERRVNSEPENVPV